MVAWPHLTVKLDRLAAFVPALLPSSQWWIAHDWWARLVQQGFPRLPPGAVGAGRRRGRTSRNKGGNSCEHTQQRWPWRCADRQPGGVALSAGWGCLGGALVTGAAAFSSVHAASGPDVSSAVFAGAAGVHALAREPLEVRLARVLGAPSTFVRRQCAVRVNLAFEPFHERGSRRGGERPRVDSCAGCVRRSAR